MIRAVVTGFAGQVASALAAKAHREADLHFTFLGRPQFDLEAPDAMADEIRRLAPDVVLSVAAYTDVDAAEDEPDKAMVINGHAPGVLAAAAAGLNIPIIHLSTDYVFSGKGNRPFTESDKTAPVTHYGRSKLRGEEEVARATPKHIILRTAWVYSSLGNNFVKTMLRMANERAQISVVNDQIGNPTSAADIADAIVGILRSPSLCRPEESAFGIFHMAGAEEASWCAFAEEIFRLSAQAGGPSAEVQPIPSSAYPTKARRPLNSRLDCSRLQAVFHHTVPGYAQALPAVVAALLADA